MTPERFEESIQAFETAIGMAPHAQQSFLQSLADEELKTLVMRLLAGSKAPTSFLDPTQLVFGALAIQAMETEILGAWRILHEIGQGGMATVYLAERADGQFRKLSALKILREGIPGHDVRRRFELERQILADLDHPNIVKLLDAGSAPDGRPYMVMDLVDGMPLMEYVTSHQLDLPARLNLFNTIGEAVSFAHQRRVIHRDLKPSNIRVTSQGIPKLLDFGIAKLITPEAIAGDQTRAGSHYFTLDYASPEQLRGRPTGTPTDVYSLGLILYELVTGQRLRNLSGLSQYDAAQATWTKKLNLRSTGNLEDTLAKALRIEPEERFADVEEFRRAVHKAATHPGIPKRWKRQIAVLTIIALCTIAWAMWRRLALFPARPPSLIPVATGQAVASHPSLSPDAKRLAYNTGVLIVVHDTGTNRQTVLPIPHNAQMPQWLSDGKRIAYIATDDADLNYVGVIDTDNGKWRQVTQVKDHFYCWAPDGESLVAADRQISEQPWTLYEVNAANGLRRQLTVPPASLVGDKACAYSPDGSRIAFIRERASGQSDIHVISRQGGPLTVVTNDRLYKRGVAWTPDGTELVYGVRSVADQFELRRTTLDGAITRKINEAPQGSLDPVLVGTPRENWRLAFAVESRDVNIWHMVPGRTPAEALIASRDQDRTPAVSPDGKKIAFVSSRSGSEEIWVSESSGHGPVRITYLNGQRTSFPRWSPDSRWIVFASQDGTASGIQVVPASGGPARTLTGGDGRIIMGRPTWSADGNWIYFRSNESGRAELWKLRSRDGAQPQQVTQGGAYEGFEDPTGTRLYFIRSADDPGLWEKLLPRGEEKLLLPSAREGFWALASQGLYFIDRPHRWTGTDVKRFLFATRSVEPVAVLPGNGLQVWTGFGVSPDGRELLWSQLDRDSVNIMMIDNFR